MLCPGCVSHGIPQAQRIREAFSQENVVVLGLHSVFEHHAAMTPVSLEAFLHEYKITFPVGVDTPHASGMPETMQAYGMQGTPTLLLIDAKPPRDAALPGGNGLAFDWQLLAGRKILKPWLLAGGLTPENVAEAIRLTGAKAVDVSSGVESAPGEKQSNLIHAFVSAATSG